MDPREDRFYTGTYGSLMEARRLNGDLLWQAPARANGRPTVWVGEDGQVLIVAEYPTSHSTIYNDQGARLWDVPGQPMWVTARYLTIQQQDRELWLYDRSGKAVMRDPQDSWLTQDGRSVSHMVGKQIEVYRLP